MNVIISDQNHPHANETGTMTGNVIKVLGEPMAEVGLDDCKHGTGCCFVSKGQVSKIVNYETARIIER